MIDSTWKVESLPGGQVVFVFGAPLASRRSWTSVKARPPLMNATIAAIAAGGSVSNRFHLV